jgi:lipoyl(octanoyl) transferase
MMLVSRHLGLQAYEPIWHAMQRFTDARKPETSDEIWFLQHFPVYTQGMAGKPEHILNPGNIPVVAIDRGGQVTYHGPGQLVGYVMLDVARRQLAPRQLVSLLEKALIELLSHWKIDAYARQDAPGIYIENRKIASLGLRIRRNASYHGLALNIDMDLTPFYGINPCGFKDISMTQLKEFVPDISLQQVEPLLSSILMRELGNAY